MTRVVFWVVAVAILLNCATVAFSIARPSARVWPPPRRDSWQYVYDGVVSLTGFVGVVALGLLDWNQFVLSPWTRFVAGGVLMACGTFGLWGYRTLGAHASSGLGDELVTTGPYRYSRNPQYVGGIASVLGWAVVANSGFAMIAALLMSVWFVLVPFAEESWCRERLGGAYDDYARSVPRFFGVRALARRG